MQDKYLLYDELKEHCKFITFRTFDSEDKLLHQILNQQNISDRRKQYQADIYLDGSNNGAFLNDNILLLLHNLLKSQDMILYDLIAFTIMPNHIHLLIVPKKNLSFTIETIKSISKAEINKILKRKGQFWENNYHTKNVKNENQLDLIYEYIKSNSLKLNEDKDLSSRFYGIYEESR